MYHLKLNHQYKGIKSYLSPRSGTNRLYLLIRVSIRRISRKISIDPFEYMIPTLMALGLFARIKCDLGLEKPSDKSIW